MGLKQFLTKEIVLVRAAPREVKCRQCLQSNELPYLFCDHCGAPRLRLGHVRVTFNLSLTMTAFLATYYYADLFAWPWSLYVLYAFLFVQVALFFVSESPTRTTRFSAWYLAILGGLGLAFHELHTEGPLFFALVLRDLPEIALEHAHIFYPVTAAVLVLALLPLYFRWMRLYGWVNAYRIGMLSIFSLLMGALLFLRGAAWLHLHGWFPKLNETLGILDTDVKQQYDRILTVLAVSVFRLFLFEIFVFAAIRGYTVSRRDELPLNREALGREDAFTRSSLILAQMVRRIGHAFEQMLVYLFRTLWHLARDLGRVILGFLREVLLPIVALAGSAVLLHEAAMLTTSYIASSSLAKIAGFLLLITALMLCEGVFLACKSRHRLSRIGHVHTQLIGWLLPNVLVFFLLISVSLYASSEAIGDLDEKGRRLPFVLGLLTRGIAALLAVVVAVVLYRKRSLFAMRPPAAVEVAAKPEEEDPPMFDEETPIVEDDEDSPPAEEAAPTRPVEYVGNRKVWDLGHRVAEVTAQQPAGRVSRAVDAAREAFEDSPLGQKTQKMFGGMRDRMAGKPEIVRQLEGVKAQLQQSLGRLSALEETRSSISTDLYGTLLAQYQGEAEGFAAGERELQAKLDQEFSHELVEARRLETELTHIQKQLAELETVHKAGAIDRREFKRRHDTIAAHLQRVRGLLMHHRRRIEFLAPLGRVAEQEYVPADEPAGLPPPTESTPEPSA